ncbi:MAG: MarR family transcriptional regulator [Chloroflexi bacterium]|jgi:DNA-binding MarR family transcriptional regulator|nr:MarR family transcriptional regulator [Chloroflexota bacterium]MBT7081446.1 MarR family transcriptional regulator [Chloroflexota bacterium]MBT7290288.1 MarR family transcriptional regulator [Chloroflexota bacterium]
MGDTTANPQTSEEYYDLWVLLQQAHYIIGRLREAELKELNLSMTQAKVLAVIESLDSPATPAEIARHVLRAPHTVSELISRMAARGLVRKVKDLGRKNMVRIEITEKGLQIYGQSKRMKYISEVVSELPAMDRKTLDSYLTKLRNLALDKVEK